MTRTARTSPCATVAADVIVTGTLSQGGEQYNMAIEAIDVKTGDYIALARSQFPKTASVQTLWDAYIQTEPVTKGQQAGSGQNQDLSITDFPPYEDKFFRIQLKNCKRSDPGTVRCMFVLTNVQSGDNRVELISDRVDNGSFAVDQNSEIHLPESMVFVPSSTRIYNLFSNLPIQIISSYKLPVTLSKIPLLQIGLYHGNYWSVRWIDVPITR